MTIKEVSEKYDISEDTLRYYEKIGLLPKIPRKNKIRNYDEKSCKWIEFIKCMRKSGLSIESLTKYMSLYNKGRKTISQRKELLIEQRNILINKQKELIETIKRLDYKIELYEEIENGKRKDFMEE